MAARKSGKRPKPRPNAPKQKPKRGPQMMSSKVGAAMSKRERQRIANKALRNATGAQVSKAEKARILKQRPKK